MLNISCKGAQSRNNEKEYIQEIVNLDLKRGRPSACVQPTQATSVHRTSTGRPNDRFSTGAIFKSIPRPIRFAACALALAFALFAAPVGAEDFRQGELEGSLDITLSHGVTLRVGDRDERLIGRAEGAGTANSVNSDDGNLNYEQRHREQRVEIHRRARPELPQLRRLRPRARVFSTSRTKTASGRAASSRPKRRIWSEKTLKSSISTSPARSTWAARRWT